MPIQLAVSPIAWSNSDLPELGEDTSLETCLSEIREAGFTGTETGIKFPNNPDMLGPMLRNYHLQLASGWFSGTLLECSVDQEFNNLKSTMRTFKKLGSNVLVYAETSNSTQGLKNVPLRRSPRMSDSELKQYGHKLTKLADRMSAFGVSMAYHHHLATMIETERDIDLLMTHTGPSVGLLMDTGHLALAGGDIEATTLRHGARIRHVHCKDLRQDVMMEVRERNMSFLDAVLKGVFTVPGDGFLDFENFARCLSDIEYSGWVVIEAEQDPEKAPPLKYSIRGKEHITAVLNRASLTVLQETTRAP